MALTESKSRNIETASPLTHLVLSHPRIIDSLGQQVQEISLGTLIGIESEILNDSSKKATFTYVVQIKDSDGMTVFMSMVRNIIVFPDESLNPSVFWLCENNGNYTVEVFVWENMQNPIP